LAFGTAYNFPTGGYLGVKSLTDRVTGITVINWSEAETLNRSKSVPRKSTISNPWVTFALCVLAVFITMPAAIAQRDDPDSRVYPPDSAPFGMTYGEWLAAEWQYALAIPASTNPALDSTGEYCGIGQSGGPVFFLVASSVPAGHTGRLPREQPFAVGSTEEIARPLPLDAWPCG